MDKFEKMKIERKAELAKIIKETGKFRIKGNDIDSKRIMRLSIIDPYQENEDGHITCSGVCELEAVADINTAYPTGCTCTFSVNAFIDNENKITIKDSYITLKPR